MTNRKGKPRKGHVVQLLSAGGVVLRQFKHSSDVVLCGHTGPPAAWGLPKGTPEPGESHQSTALREVNEETGLQVKIQSYIGEIEYWFVRPEDQARCHKTVLYYLMRSTGGDTALHDHEFDDVQWFPVDEAIKALQYENEIRMVKKALEIIKPGDDG